MTEHIVVGVDDTAGSRAAITWALREADVKQASLEAVYVYLENDSFDQDTATAKLKAIVDAVKAETGSSIEPELTVIFGESAHHGLVHVSSSADLLVVGASQHVIDRMLGSVSSACVHQAHCPVVVVRSKQ